MLYFFNVNEVKCTDKKLTRGLGYLGDFYHFIVWRSENLVLSNEFIKVELQRQLFIIRSDEGLTLETSAFQIFHGCNSTFIKLV